MFQSIINKELDFPKTTPVTSECRSILRGLLHKYPDKRLGNRSSEDIRKHPWFKDLDWGKLLSMEVFFLLMQIVPGYIPELASE